MQRHAWKRIAIAGLLLLLMLTAVPVAASATTYFVRTDGSDAACNGKTNAPATSPPNCAFATIGKAIAVAAAGDTIKVGAGTYLEQIVIGKSLTLSGAGATIKAPPVVIPFATMSGFQNAIGLV